MANSRQMKIHDLLFTQLWYLSTEIYDTERDKRNMKKLLRGENAKEKQQSTFSLGNRVEASSWNSNQES